MNDNFDDLVKVLDAIKVELVVLNIIMKSLDDKMEKMIK